MSDETEGLRLLLAEEPRLEDDPAPPKKIRYIFTVVMPEQLLPDNPLAQRVYLDKVMGEIQDHLKPERVGVVAVMEGEGDGKVEGR